MQFDYLDMTHRILVMIRSDIENDSNVEILKRLVESMMNQSDSNELIFIIIQFNPSYLGMLGLSSLGKSSRELPQKVGTTFFEVMSYALNRIIDLITIKQYEYAYAIADSIHAFPTILLEADDRSMKQYWKQDIEPVREKWDRSLYNEVRLYFEGN